MNDMNMNNEPPVYDSGDIKPTDPIPTEGENDAGLTEELPVYGDTPTDDRDKHKKIIAIAAGVVLIAGLGIGAFALSSHKTANTQPTEQEQTVTPVKDNSEEKTDNLSISLSIQFVDLFKQFRLLFGSGIEFLPLLFKGNTDCLFLPLLVGFLGLCRPFLQYLDLSSNLGFLGSQFRHLSILLFQLVSELGFRLGCVPVCKLFNGCDLFLLLSHLLL